MRFRSPLYIITAVALVIFACGGPILQNRNNNKLVNYVDPFIGTAFHGHTFPGATLPFGMVQLSPDTHMFGWEASSGYHYEDTSLYGFSHTHLSGTGIGDLGDILFLPFTGEIPAEKPVARLDHNLEEATPGYYKIVVAPWDITAELTATKRTGVHRYTFPEAAQAGILIDLTHTLHGHKNPLHELRVVNEQEIQGLKLTSGWARHHTVYFTAKFSRPFET